MTRTRIEKFDLGDLKVKAWKWVYTNGIKVFKDYDAPRYLYGNDTGDVVSSTECYVTWREMHGKKEGEECPTAKRYYYVVNDIAPYSLNAKIDRARRMLEARIVEAQYELEQLGKIQA